MGDRVDFDKYTENYNQLLKEKTEFFTSDEAYFAKYKVDIVRKHVISPVSRLLEYGCGIGRNISFLQQAFPGASITGSDISEASLEIAKRDNPEVDFLIENIDFQPKGQFDIIFVAGVFHHIPVADRVQSAKKLFDRLLPGGSLFVFEHNPYNPITRRIVSNCVYDEDAVLLKPFELQKILERVELEVEHKAYCLFVPPRLSILAGIEEKLGWLPLGGQYWMQAKRLL